MLCERHTQREREREKRLKIKTDCGVCVKEREIYLLVLYTEQIIIIAAASSRNRHGPN
jgi:hypothetical protein